MNIEIFKNTVIDGVSYNKDMIRFLSSEKVQKALEEFLNELADEANKVVQPKVFQSIQQDMFNIRDKDMYLHEDVVKKLMLEVKNNLYQIKGRNKHLHTFYLLYFREVVEYQLLNGSPNNDYKFFYYSLITSVLESLHATFESHLGEFVSPFKDMLYNAFGDVEFNITLDEQTTPAKFTVAFNSSAIEVGDYFKDEQAVDNLYVLREKLYAFMLIVHGLGVELPENTNVLSLVSEEYEETLDVVSKEFTEVTRLIFKEMLNTIQWIFKEKPYMEIVEHTWKL